MEDCAIAGLLLPVMTCTRLVGLSKTQTKLAADLIVANAKIWTVDKTLPTARGVAVLGARIVAVGSNSDVDRSRGLCTQVIDAVGKLLLPGFNDAHVHFVSGGLQLTNCSTQRCHDKPRNLHAASASAPFGGATVMGVKVLTSSSVREPPHTCNWSLRQAEDTCPGRPRCLG